MDGLQIVSMSNMFAVVYRCICDGRSVIPIPINCINVGGGCVNCIVLHSLFTHKLGKTAMRHKTVLRYSALYVAYIMSCTKTQRESVE